MTFHEVKVKAVDDKDPYLYPSRTIEIVMSRSITTPTRAATLTEYNHKDVVPTETAIDNEVSISITKVNLARLDSFLHKNGVYGKISSNLSLANEAMKYSAFRAHIIEPTTSPTVEIADDKSEIPVISATDYLSSNPTKREKFLTYAIRMQIDLGLEIVTIPYLELAWSQYSEVIKATTNSVRKAGREPMFIFDLAYGNEELFAQAISFFINEADVKLLGFNYKSYGNYNIAYDTLSDYIRKDVAFFSLDVTRQLTGNSLSTMHHLPFLGNDIYTVKSPRYFPPPPLQDENAAGLQGMAEGTNSTNSREEIKKENIKFFNPKTLIVEPSLQRVSHPSQILAEILEPNNRKLLDILNEFSTIDMDQDKLVVLRSLSKVHELKSSTIEFSSMQKRISSRESTEYAKEKNTLDSTLTKLKERRRKN